MNEVVSFIYDFVLLFLLILIVYLVFINKNKQDYSKLKENSIVKNFIAKYNLDMRKTKYKSVLNILSIINSFILSFCATLMLHLKIGYWKYVIVFLTIMALIYSLYEIAGRYFRKKEDDKNV
jgi:Ca2+/Na+ antiporter